MDKRREPGSASHLGIRGRGAVEELRGEWWHLCAANTVEVMAEGGEGVREGERGRRFWGSVFEC